MAFRTRSTPPVIPRRAGAFSLRLALVAWPALLAGELPASGEKFWNRSVASALEAGKISQRWVVIYFPAPKLQIPPAIPSPSLSAWLEKRAVGGQVGAAEVKVMEADFKIQSYPAAVLIDPFGNAVSTMQSEEQIKDLWNHLQNLDNRLKNLLADLDRKAAQIDQHLETGEPDLAIQLCQEVLNRSREGFPQRRRAEQVLKKLEEEAAAEGLKTMAQEGLIPDRELSRQLTALAARYPLKNFQDKIGREKSRLLERKIGGKE